MSKMVAQLFHDDEARNQIIEKLLEYEYQEHQDAGWLDQVVTEVLLVRPSGSPNVYTDAMASDESADGRRSRRRRNRGNDDGGILVSQS